MPDSLHSIHHDEDVSVSFLAKENLANGTKAEEIHLHLSKKQRIAKKFSRFSKFYGLILGILSASFLSISNVLVKKVKILSGSEQALSRYVIQLFISVAIIFITKNHLLGEKLVRKTLILRGFFGMIYLISLNFALKLINPSDAVSLVHLNIVLVSVLARILLKEKINIANILSLILAIFGVFLIAQPSFLFPKKPIVKLKLNSTGEEVFLNCTNVLNNCTASTKLTSDEMDESTKKLIGFLIAFLSSIATALTAILLKKLSNCRVHYSVAIVYGPYFGIPASALITLIMLLTGAEKKDPKILENIPSLIHQIIFCIISGVSGVFSQILMSMALKFEDASKVSMLRSTELFFTFILQYLILNIKSNAYSIIGACLICLCTFLILIYKSIDQKLSREAKENEQNGHKIKLWKRILLVKF